MTRPVLAAVAVAAVLAAMTVTAAPAAAVTCPSGSVTFHTGPDANGNQVVQNADNYGSGSATCFTYGPGGQLTVTQADPANHVSPTSYPDDGYGCGKSYCSTGWTSRLWSTVSMTISGAIDPSGVAAGGRYDLLIDSLFTTSPGTFTAPQAEVEIVTWAAPSYTGLGFCAAAACGATPVTIGCDLWWLKYKQATNGTVTWGDWIFVRDTMTTTVTGLPLHDFYAAADSGGQGGLGTLNLGTAELGTEFWQDGTGMKLVTVTAANLP